MHKNFTLRHCLSHRITLHYINPAPPLKIERNCSTHHSRFDRVFHNAILTACSGRIGIVISVGDIVGGRTQYIEKIEFHFVGFVLITLRSY